jgi:spore coat protein A
MLNGSTSRTYTLSLSNAAGFYQIGTELGLLGAPVPLSSLTLGPGERADVVIDFAPYAPGAEIILTNSAPTDFPGEPGVGVIPNVMKFIVTAAAGYTAPLPASLRPVVPIPESQAARSRDMVLRLGSDPCTGEAWFINSLRWEDITDFPRLDTTEIWNFVNRSALMHPMHMHLVAFQVLDRQDFTVINGEVVPVGSRIPPDGRTRSRACPTRSRASSPVSRTSPAGTPSTATSSSTRTTR